MKELYKSINEKAQIVVEPTKRSEVCSLKNAIDANIDGKLFCLAHIGPSKHRNALELCQSLNATLPLPKSITEHKHFVQSFKRLGIEKKMFDFSTKIVLNVRRLSDKGSVSFLLFNSK